MAGSLFADDAVAAAVATAVANDDAAAAAAAAAAVAVVAVVVPAPGFDIGGWVGVFGAALPGPAVPYRWDDMYHQKPGLAVCL